MKNKVLLTGFSALMALIVIGTSACNQTSGDSTDPGTSTTSVHFDYSTTEYADILGSRTNDEEHDYSALKVNPLSTTIREDFAYGVDASMVHQIEENGGVYYNANGQEQDVFQILNQNGVNFMRLRLWNKPHHNRYATRTYGGGNNTAEVDIAMAKRAQAANMNVMVDFHYSDFWADPDRQWIPKDWGAYQKDDISNLLYEFTRDTLQQFKDEGVNVQAVQVGNEINNGMVDQYGAINWNDQENSFDYIAELLNAGIRGVKEVFPSAYTVVHLANGGNKDEYDTFFTELQERNVNYDIIGASFYPYMSGSVTNLTANLNNLVEKFNKPVMIVETSWGFTTEYNEYTSNTFNESSATAGGYLVSEQAQATMMRDLIDLLASVPNQQGLGIFYWEPAWLPVSGASWASKYGQSYQYHGDDSHSNNYEDGLATWSNQGLFSYSGKALSSIQTYKLVQEGGQNPSEETAIRADYDPTSPKTVTINLAANETLPTTYNVITDFDAYRAREITWTAESIEAVKTKGDHTVTGTVAGFEITMIAHCIENYVVDPGFELQDTKSDVIGDPWKINATSPSGEKVVKLDRKSDMRSGTTDMNWYYASDAFSFDVSQTITGMPAGTYDLRTYVLGYKSGSEANTSVVLYVKINGTEQSDEFVDSLEGWSAGYVMIELSNLVVPEGATVEIGLRASAVKSGWGHNDDWELVAHE